MREILLEVELPAEAEVNLGLLRSRRSNVIESHLLYCMFRPADSAATLPLCFPTHFLIARSETSVRRRRRFLQALPCSNHRGRACCCLSLEQVRYPCDRKTTVCNDGLDEFCPAAETTQRGSNARSATRKKWSCPLLLRASSVRNARPIRASGARQVIDTTPVVCANHFGYTVYDTSPSLQATSAP